MDPLSIGLLLSLITFLRSEIKGRKSQEELLARIKDQNAVQEFLEWFRSQDHEALVSQLNEHKSELLTEVSELGDRLREFENEVRKNMQGLEGVVQYLDARIRPPVLSPLALPSRRRANIPIEGRDGEIEQLINSKGDVLISGQPGSGKTELLQIIANRFNGNFILTDNAEIAVEALLQSSPSIVIVDDCGTKEDLLQRLRHFRQEKDLDYRIFASCWPFDNEDIQRAIGINNSQTVDLKRLPNKVIGKIVKDLAKLNHLEVNDGFLRAVVQQANGMPGLATSLTLETFSASGGELASGKLLFKELRPFLRQNIGDDALQILGAFACGGRNGISYLKVSEALGETTLKLRRFSEKIALAGILEQVDKDTLCVQPPDLRSWMLKEIFFTDERVSLPSELCLSLIQTSRDPVYGYVELIQAYHRSGLNLPKDELMDATRRCDDARLWTAMARLDRSACEWVLSQERLSGDIKRAALHYMPEKIIPEMLDAAIGDKRPLNAHPEADLRLLEDWVKAGFEDAFDRRRILFQSVHSWWRSGGDIETAFSAFVSVFCLEHSYSDTDPVEENLFRFKTGVILLGDAKKVFELWETLKAELEVIDGLPWEKVVRIVENWQHAGGIGSLPEDYKKFLVESIEVMITDLIPIAGRHQGVLKWLYRQSERHGLNVDALPLDPGFLALFPLERRGDDWRTEEKRRIACAQDLAIKWKERQFSDIVQDMCVWDEQAQCLGRVWPQMMEEFASKLMEVRPLGDRDLQMAVTYLPVPAAGRFLNEAIAQGEFSQQCIELALQRPDLHGVLIRCMLSGKRVDLYPCLEKLLPRWIGMIEDICLRRETTIDMLDRLLRHEDRKLRHQVAFYAFRGSGSIPESISYLWKGVVVEAFVENLQETMEDPPYDFEKVLASNEDIPQAVIEGILLSDKQIFDTRRNELLSQLVTSLEKEKRRELLRRCVPHIHAPLLTLLVGKDEDLYADLLRIPEAEDSHFRCLVGDPNEGNWCALAKCALKAGYSHYDVATAVNYGGFSCSGEISRYFQNWVERFTLLSDSLDYDVQRIAEEGIKWATSSRDEHRRYERLRELK